MLSMGEVYLGENHHASFHNDPFSPNLITLKVRLITVKVSQSVETISCFLGFHQFSIQLKMHYIIGCPPCLPLGALVSQKGNLKLNCIDTQRNAVKRAMYPTTENNGVLPFHISLTSH